MKLKPTAALILLLLLMPPIWIGLDYVVGSPGGPKVYSMNSGESDWSGTLTVSYPQYLVSGGSATVTVTFQMAPGTNMTILVQDFRIELRNPSRIHNVTSAVQSWGILSNSTIRVHQNYTSANQVSGQGQVPILYPPTSGPFDLFRPTSQVAMNGAVDLIVYRQNGNGSSATPFSISVLDGQVVYQSQLSLVRSSASWVAYELVAIAIVVPLYLWQRRGTVFPADTAYTMQLEEFRLKSNLAKLEELFAAGNVTEAAYKELKEKYEGELARVRGDPLSESGG